MALPDIPFPSQLNLHPVAQWGHDLQRWARRMVDQSKVTLGVRSVDTDADVEPEDLPVLIVDSSAGPVVVTLYPSSEESQDGLIHRRWIHHAAGDPLTVIIEGGETFSDGLSKYILPTGQTMQLGCMYGGGWMRTSASSMVTQIARTAAWAAGNFSSPTEVPFDNAQKIDNDAICDWDITTPTDLVIGLDGRYMLNYHAGIDSTGGSTWIVNAWLELGGTEIPGTRLRTGNYGGEDQAISLPCRSVDLAAGDVITLVLEQTSLTGSMTDAVISIATFA